MEKRHSQLLVLCRHQFMPADSEIQLRGWISKQLASIWGPSSTPLPDIGRIDVVSESKFR